MSTVEVSVPVERSKTEGATLKSTDSKSQMPCQGAKGSGDTASGTALYTALTVLLKIPKGTVHCCITLKAEKKRGCDIYSVHLCIVRTCRQCILLVIRIYNNGTLVYLPLYCLTRKPTEELGEFGL